jgi:gliding motility-associated lipoprotein GldH
MKTKMKRISKICIPGVLLVLAFTACNLDSVYEKSVDISKGDWSKNQVIKFEIPVTDTINGNDMYFSIRNNNEYPYKNLFLFITTLSPKGISKKDTLEITLADDRGKWSGRGFGGIWSNEPVFKKDVRFPSAGTYTIEVVQAMRDQLLKGILDVGIKVERAK